MTKLTLLLGLVVIVAILVSEIECRRQRRGKWRGRWAKRRGIGRGGVDLDSENEAVGLQHAQVETNSTDIPQRQKWRLQKRKQKFLKKLQKKNKKFQMRLEKLGQIETNNTADDMAIQPPRRRWRPNKSVRRNRWRVRFSKRTGCFCLSSEKMAELQELIKREGLESTFPEIVDQSEPEIDEQPDDSVDESDNEDVNEPLIEDNQEQLEVLA